MQMSGGETRIAGKKLKSSCGHVECIEPTHQIIESYLPPLGGGKRKIKQPPEPSEAQMHEKRARLMAQVRDQLLQLQRTLAQQQPAQQEQQEQDDEESEVALPVSGYVMSTQKNPFRDILYGSADE